jgi:release factor glutamine methyltransferase
VTIHDHVAAARERLRAAGIPPDEADRDARLLARRVLRWDAARLITSAHEQPPPDFAEFYDRLVSARAGREPMAYLTGEQEFWGLPFAVTMSVLIPRPETELIVEASLELFPDRDADLHVADVGTGSGCLAVALAHERPRARVIAGDTSAAALFVAGHNARRHGVYDRIEFITADLLTGAPFADATFDLVVSNPPYVPELNRTALQPEVRSYEPPEALFAGPDGLSVIRRLMPQAAARLKPGGYLVFEFGLGQDDAVDELISTTGRLTMVDLRRDLQGIARTAIARRV